MALFNGTQLMLNARTFFLQTIPALFWTLVPLPAFLHTAAWAATREPIEELLNTPTTAIANNAPLKDDLTKRWRDSMQLQLNVVAVTSALVGGIVTTALTWRSIASSDQIKPSTGYSSWPVRWLWYMTLIFSVTSAAAAMQLAIFLHRLSSYPDGIKKIQNLLGEQVGIIALANPPHYIIRQLQLVTWQIPMMLLNGSIYTFLIGLVWLISDGVSLHRGWQSRDTKVDRDPLHYWTWTYYVQIFAFSIPGVIFCAVCYFVVNIGSYGRLRSL